MGLSSPVIAYGAAGEREGGARCPHCQNSIGVGEPIGVCQKCGAVHHQGCAQRHGGCGAYACAPAHVVLADPARATIQITAADLEASVPPPTQRPMVSPTSQARAAPAGVHRGAVAAFICALAGIPIFGLVTGLVAILLGSLAVGATRRSGQRGTGWAVAGILLGLADIVGWVLFLSLSLSGDGGQLHLPEFEPDVEATRNLPAPLRDAMLANVLIERSGAWGGALGSMTGSGVMLQLAGGKATAITNRHVVDPDFPADGAAVDVGRLAGATIWAQVMGQPRTAARVVWLAPEGIDLALIEFPVTSVDARAAKVARGREASIGDTVFAVGNPHRLGWTHTSGVISQFRTWTIGGRQLRVFQTQAAINPGNSGGGLYDKEGYLLAINSWTNDKRVSEGLNFAISIDMLFEVAPTEVLDQLFAERSDGNGADAKTASRP